MWIYDEYDELNIFLENWNFVLALNDELSIFAALSFKWEKGGEVDERLKSVVC